MSKFLILAIILNFFIVMPKSPARGDIVNSHCQAMGLLAEEIMRDRQGGQSPTEVLERHVTPQDPALQSTVRDMVFAAFDKTMFMNANSRMKTITDFRNDVEIQCYRDLVDSQENS